MSQRSAAASSIPSSQPSTTRETPTLANAATPRPLPETDGEDEVTSGIEDEDEMEVDEELPTSKAVASKRYLFMRVAS